MAAEKKRARKSGAEEERPMWVVARSPNRKKKMRKDAREGEQAVQGEQASMPQARRRRADRNGDGVARGYGGRIDSNPLLIGAPLPAEAGASKAYQKSSVIGGGGCTAQSQVAEKQNWKEEARWKTTTRVTEIGRFPRTDVCHVSRPVRRG